MESQSHDPFAVPDHGGGPRQGRSSRRTTTIVAAIGLAAVVALTAGTVVLLGRTDSPDTARRAPATPAAASSSSASSDRGKDAGGSSTAAAPTPSSTVTGSVDDGVHGGDLRYFLLDPPARAELYGDEEGTTLGRDEVAAVHENPEEAEDILDDLGFEAGAHRTYLTADGETEVHVELLRFTDADSARDFTDASSHEGEPVALSGRYPARGYRLVSSSPESVDSLLAVAHQGDVHITLSITGADKPKPELLRSLLDEQYERLRTGR